MMSYLAKKGTIFHEFAHIYFQSLLAVLPKMAASLTLSLFKLISRRQGLSPHHTSLLQASPQCVACSWNLIGIYSL